MYTMAHKTPLESVGTGILYTLPLKLAAEQHGIKSPPAIVYATERLDLLTCFLVSWSLQLCVPHLFGSHTIYLASVQISLVGSLYLINTLVLFSSRIPCQLCSFFLFQSSEWEERKQMGRDGCPTNLPEASVSVGLMDRPAWLVFFF